MSNIKEINIEELMTDKNKIVTEQIAARIIGIPYQSLKRSIRWKNKITFHKLNGRIGYRISDIIEFLERSKTPAIQD
jgi:hypothetical protein